MKFWLFFKTCNLQLLIFNLHREPTREKIVQEIAGLSARTELDVEVGEMLLVDFGKKWGKLSSKVLDDPEVVEGQYIRVTEKAKKGSFR